MPRAASAAVTTPGDPTPQELLERSFEAMRQASSFRFQLDGTLEPTGGGFSIAIPIRVEVDYQAPDRVRSKLSVSLGFFALEMETVTIGDTTYTLNAESGEWEVATGAVSAMPSPSEFTQGGVPTADNIELIGVETLNGVLAYRLRLVAPLALFGGSESQAQADFWISVDESLLLRVTAEGLVPLDEVGAVLGEAGISGIANVSIAMEFSDYNAPIVIEAPIP